MGKREGGRSGVRDSNLRSHSNLSFQWKFGVTGRISLNSSVKQGDHSPASWHCVGGQGGRSPTPPALRRGSLSRGLGLGFKAEKEKAFSAP